MLSKNKIKYIQSLGQKKFREEYGCFIAEGPKIVEELLQPGNLKIREILALPEWIRRHPGLDVTAMEEFELEKISHLQTPNQVLALVYIPDPAQLPDAREELVLALDDIRDPGNLGTLIRIGDWFGIKNIVCSAETTDAFNPKTVQSAMGSLQRVHMHYTDLAGWIFEQTNTPVYATVLEGEDVRQLSKTEKGVLLIGSEAHGLKPELIEMASQKITIAARGHAESLNAAVAAGIVLSHLLA